MEGSDPFSGGVDTDETDPFATEGGAGAFDQSGDDPFKPDGDEAAEGEAGAAASTEPPIVNREGEPVAADASGGADGGEDGAAQAAATEPAAAEQAPDRALTEAAAAAVEGEDPTSGSSDASAEAASSAEPGEAAGDETGTDMARAEAAANGAAPAEEAAPEPQQAKGTGADAKRPYKLLQPAGTGKWEDVTWWEDKAGNMVAKGTEGAVKRNECLVRGQEEALRIGYRALGSPPDGAKLVAVPGNYFKVKTISPDVVPARQKLKIS